MAQDHDLKAIIASIDEQLDAIDAEAGPFEHAAYTEWRARHDAAVERAKAVLAERYGARFTYRAAHDHTVAIAGIRSTSTGGWSGALHNWKRAAARKLGHEPS